MKKKYIAPQTEIIRLEGTESLMDTSGHHGVSYNNEYGIDPFDPGILPQAKRNNNGWVNTPETDGIVDLWGGDEE